MPYHIGSFDAATVDGLGPTGKIVAIASNPFNNNKCVAYEDADFSKWGAALSSSVQQVFPLPAGAYFTVMPLSSTGPCLYCSFPTLPDLLDNAQFTPNLDGGSIAASTFSGADEVAIFLSNIGGMLIIPPGIPFVG